MINKIISNVFGKIASHKYPSKIQEFVNSKYVDFYKVDLSEFDDIKSYKSLNELFTRKLKKPRKIDESKTSFLSPSDSLCLNIGDTKNLQAQSIKGHFYDIDALLGELINDEEKKKELTYINLYLSPKDYHHYHSPANMQILASRYFSGNLYSVSPSILKLKKNLYSTNERVALKCKLENEEIIWLIFVAALNVGKMKFDFDERLTSKDGKDKTYKYENLSVKKAQHLGNFELGSTILIINEKQAIKYDLKEGENIKFAQVIGQIEEKK